MNYTYGSKKFLPVGTIVKIVSLEQHKHLLGKHACLLDSGKFLKDIDGNNCWCYGSNVFVEVNGNNVRQSFTRDTFEVVSYPVLIEAWLNSKINALKCPLEECHEDVRMAVQSETSPYLEKK